MSKRIFVCIPLFIASLSAFQGLESERGYVGATFLLPRELTENDLNLAANSAFPADIFKERPESEPWHTYLAALHKNIAFYNDTLTKSMESLADISADFFTDIKPIAAIKNPSIGFIKEISEKLNKLSQQQQIATLKSKIKKSLRDAKTPGARHHTALMGKTIFLLEKLINSYRAKLEENIIQRPITPLENMTARESVLANLKLKKQTANVYSILGVNSGSSIPAIKKKYISLKRQWDEESSNATTRQTRQLIDWAYKQLTE